jgi:hypothetical protein
LEQNVLNLKTVLYVLTKWKEFLEDIVYQGPILQPRDWATFFTRRSGYSLSKPYLKTWELGALHSLEEVDTLLKPYLTA